ncbi:hypothetical protein E4T42_08859 [Aureobasidium subglaciale]|nr:hypothetical protein E4T42_08859 [Aureobasidium subglaciale]
MTRFLSGTRPCMVISLSHVLAVHTRAASKTVWTQSAPETITQHSVIHSRLIIALRRATVAKLSVRFSWTLIWQSWWLLISERDIQETTRLC